jgi:spermidine/putrescine transport system permease protein
MPVTISKAEAAMATRARRWGKWLVSGPPLLYLLVFFAVPSLIMVLASFRTPGEFGGLAPLVDENGALDLTLESYARFFGEPLYAGIFVKSAGYALATTLICLVLAYPLAALIARSERKHRDLLLLLVILPFWSNFLIRVYAWMIILGPNAAFARAVNGVLALFGQEPVSLLFSSFAVLVCLVYVHLPFMVLPLYANLEKHDQALLDAAQDLGANAWQRFWRITFPLSLPGVYAGAALVFIPRIRHLRDSRHPGRARRQPDRQRDQAAVPRDARLAVRQRAVDRADGERARPRRARGMGRAAHDGPAGERRCVAGRHGCGAPRFSRTRSFTCRSLSSSCSRSTTRG